jgi:hypothetical protein
MHPSGSILLGNVMSGSACFGCLCLELGYRWLIRYNLEVELEKIYSIEELHLKRRSGIKWTLKGDANNRFFHGAANGRRRRTSIFYLENDGVEIRELDQIRNHVDHFFKDLFSAETDGDIRLGENF